jgi:hypothetical protein
VTEAEHALELAAATQERAELIKAQCEHQSELWRAIREELEWSDLNEQERGELIASTSPQAGSADKRVAEVVAGAHRVGELLTTLGETRPENRPALLRSQAAELESLAAGARLAAEIFETGNELRRRIDEES